MENDAETKVRLTEVYKLHVNIANEVSNRRAGVNRLYILILSGIMFGMGAILRSDAGSLLNKLMGQNGFSIMIAFVGIFGVILCAIWRVSIESYLNANSVRYEVLRELEKKLDFQFYGEEWEKLNPLQRDYSYRKLARIELYTPTLFLILFAPLFIFGVYLASCDALLAFYCGIVMVVLVVCSMAVFSISNKPMGDIK